MNRGEVAGIWARRGAAVVVGDEGSRAMVGEDDVGDKDSKSRAAGKKGKMGGFIEYNR